MKKIGIVLIILQCLAVISRIVQKESFLELGFAGLIGFFIFGIVGVILIIKSKKQ